MRIQLSDHFTYKRLLRFVLPSILMILCTSVYSIVDGVFISNFVGKTPFAAINLIMPVLMGVGAIGFMIGTGGSAIVSKTMGEGKQALANEMCIRDSCRADRICKRHGNCRYIGSLPRRRRKLFAQCGQICHPKCRGLFAKRGRQGDVYKRQTPTRPRCVKRGAPM